MRWLVIIWALIGLTSISDGAPTGGDITMESFREEPISPDTTTSASPSSSSSSSSSSASSSLSSARKLPTHDVGLPSELAWQAWLVVANQPDLAQSSFESATVPRRISPKSVFVAPALHACSDGYKADSMGRCVKDTIQINYKTHLEFILERLRAKFPSTVQLDDSAATGPDLKESAALGPLQVNISLGIEDNLSASRSPTRGTSGNSERKTESDNPTEISVVRVPQVDALKLERIPEAVKIEADPTTYGIAKGAENGGEEKEGTFFRGNTSQTFEHLPIREVVVPVAEFVDDGNQTFTQVIDYQIPLSLGQLLNNSNSKPLPLAENSTGTKIAESQQQPTVVLLLAEAKVTGTPSTPYIKDPDSSPLGIVKDEVLIGTDILAINSTGKGEIQINVTELNSTPEDVTAEENEEVTPTDDGVEETTLSQFSETLGTTSYPEEEIDEATDSNDEILAHGEAGMLVSAGKFPATVIPPEDSERQSSTPGVSTSGKTPEESGANISSESSISGDIILETTLLDLNTGRTPTQGKLDDLRELFEVEKDVDLEPEVVFSLGDSSRIERPSSRGKKRPEELAVSAETVRPLSVVGLGDSTPMLDSIPQETVAHVSRQKSDGDYSPGEQSHLQQRRRTASSQDYVRFPDDPRHPSSSYVLFPSDHTNSINRNLNYKERPSLANEDTRPHTIPKNSVSHHQKKTYWHLQPGWRIDDLQPPRRQPVAIQNGNQRQNPMLFRFWTRMPLFRDPSLTGNNQSSRTSTIVNQSDSIYKSISVRTGQPIG